MGGWERESERGGEDSGTENEGVERWERGRLQVALESTRDVTSEAGVSGGIWRPERERERDEEAAGKCGF